MSATAAAPVKNLLIDDAGQNEKCDAACSPAPTLSLPSETNAHHRHPFVLRRVAHSQNIATNLLNVHSIRMDKQPFFIHF
jgi:hypothetical protein